MTYVIIEPAPEVLELLRLIEIIVAAARLR